MSDVAVHLEKIGKKYHIGAIVNRHKNLQDVLMDTFVSPFRRAAKLLRGAAGATDPEQTIWALRDVSLDIKHGEIVGSIGRNGAGKSTLLKILSRITEPTEGFAEIRGRVGSLLDVGTGFHPELTGRENLFLNGAILGMRRAEIQRKFDEIVSFAEIEKFIDTPVKHYSSGMYVRLAFAVAAHLEPEILIVDEVLAVGDAAFQKKCLGRMSEVSRAGRTVIFVSHNMSAIENLCRQGIVIQAGGVMLSGEMKQAVDYYLHSIAGLGRGHSSHIVDLSNTAGRPAKCRPLLKRLELYTDQDSPLNGGLRMGAGLKAYIHFKLEEPTSNFGACLAFDSLFGQRVFTAHSVFQLHQPWGERVGEQVFICEIPSLTLVPGEYKIKVALDIHNSEQDCVEDAARLAILESDYYGTGRVPWSGTFVLKHRWQLGDAQKQ